MKGPIGFPALVQAFFSERLMHQRQASPHTIASYRDTFRLLLKFASERLGKKPSSLAISDLDVPFIAMFLNHLEKDRGISSRSRNVRLAAVHSFFRYVALQEPSCCAVAQRVLAMPSKRFERRSVRFLTRVEIDALLSAPDKHSWGGRRDWTLLTVAVQTGLRVSELVGLRPEDVVFGSGAHIRCRGKGRKERCTPLRKDVITALRAWFRERNGRSSDFLFPNARGGKLSSDGVEYLLAKHLAIARHRCPSLRKKRVTSHVLRHSLAMELLRQGVDRGVIALWLGHEGVETTQMYLHADPVMKEKALAKTSPLKGHPGRFRPDDQLMAFLKSL